MGIGAYVLWRFLDRSSPAAQFPELDEGAVLFYETFASGKTLGGAVSALGNVNNCLAVTVTDEELWLSASFPMSMLVRLVGMEHRVPLTDVSGVEGDGRKAAIVDFTGSDGETRRVRLVLRERDRFLETLGDRLAEEGS